MSAYSLHRVEQQSTHSLNFLAALDKLGRISVRCSSSCSDATARYLACLHGGVGVSITLSPPKLMAMGVCKTLIAPLGRYRRKFVKPPPHLEQRLPGILRAATGLDYRSDPALDRPVIPLLWQGRASVLFPLVLATSQCQAASASATSTRNCAELC